MPADSPKAHSAPFLLQTPFILLDGSLTAGTALRDELGQVLALGLHTHAIIVAAIIDPLRHVATAGRVVCLEQEGEVRTLTEGGPPAIVHGRQKGGRFHLEDDRRRSKAQLGGGG